MDPFKVMEIVTFVLTILMFLTGIPPCVSMYRTSNTKNVPFNIFLLSVVSCSGMVHYGILMSIPTVTFINIIGFLLQTVYTFTYIACVKSKGKPLFLTGLAALYVSLLYGYCFSALQTDLQVAAVVGASSSYITTCIMLLPSLELIGNFRDKNADGMPLVMLIGSLLCSSSWLIFGLMLDDANIYRPNIPNIPIVFGKLYANYLYGGKTEKAKAE